MMEEIFVVVLFDKDGNKVHESQTQTEYPSKEMIDYGLSYKDVAYANVEKRYRRVTEE